MVVVAASVALLAAPVADATFAARISVNRSVVDAGAPVRIELRSYTLDKGLKQLDDRTGRHLGVDAVSPEGWVEHVALRHVARGVWRGTYRFGGAGKWEVRVANWPADGPGPRLFVRVR